MGLSAVTKLDSGTNAAPVTATQATASKSPTAYRTQAIAVLSTKIGGALAAPTLSGNGLTWTQTDTVTYNTVAVPLSRLTVFKSSGAAPTTGAVTITHASTPTAISWYWVESDKDIFPASAGVDNHAHNNLDAATSITATLAAFKDASNGVLAFFAYVTGVTPTAGTGFTSLGVESTILDAEWRADNDTTVDETFATSNAAVIALELDTGNRATPEHQASDWALTTPNGGNGAVPDVSKAAAVTSDADVAGQFALHVKYVVAGAKFSASPVKVTSGLTAVTASAFAAHAVSVSSGLTAAHAVAFVPHPVKITSGLTVAHAAAFAVATPRITSGLTVPHVGAFAFGAADVHADRVVPHVAAFAVHAAAVASQLVVLHVDAFVVHAALVSHFTGVNWCAGARRRPGT